MTTRHTKPPNAMSRAEIIGRILAGSWFLKGAAFGLGWVLIERWLG